MVKVLGFRFVLLVGVLVFFASSCVIAAEAGLRWLVSPELLRHAGFEMVWANELPMKKTESLERLFILGNRIYALSDRNFMVSLNREGWLRLTRNRGLCAAPKVLVLVLV